MNRVAPFGSGNRGPLTTTVTTSYPTSIVAISSMTCTTASSSSSSRDNLYMISGSSTSLPASVPHPSAPTSQAGTVVDVNPQHPLQPMLKSIMDELRRTYNEVKKVQEEQKRMNATLAHMNAASFAIESSP